MLNKIPVSILAIIYNEKQQILLLKRTNSKNFWQSVTGSLDNLQEHLNHTAAREIFEETGLIITQILDISIHNINPMYIHQASFYTLYNLNYQLEYKIYPQFLYKYAKGITKNIEHWFCLKIPSSSYIKISPVEHTKYVWLPWYEACKICFSPNNAQAISCLFM